ncbi:MAG: hypothetical protein ACTHV2_10260 [Brachybacterium sp.]|nr:hypothetical protein [Brachybacterium sp.]MDN6301837.1 hypothetical protein [Brachybacterium sp.]MDN6328678.1 hypothetical protein [Brachybacterium sp.]
MFGALAPLLVLLFIAPVLLLVGVLIAAGVLGTYRTGLHRGALFARWVGFLLGILVVGLLVGAGANGVPGSGPLAFGALAALGPAAGGLVLVLAIAAGELTLPAPTTTVRRASLRRRTLGDLVPRAALVLDAVALGAFALVTTVSTLLATSGRFFSTMQDSADGSRLRSIASPFPGAHYTVPIWASLLLLVVSVVLVLRLILHRRPSDDPQDILLRRRSSTSVLGALVLSCALTLVPVAGLMAMPLASASGPWTGFALVVAGLGVLVGGLALLAGLVMVVFPEVIARRPAAADGPAPELVVEGHGPAAAGARP